MSLADRRAVEQREDVRGGGRLPRERPELVDARQEAVARGLQRVDRQRAGHVGRLGEPPRTHDPERRERAHELRAVDEREPFLRFEAERLEPRPRKRVAALEQLAVEPRTPFADEREREVGQRSEVAARADGSAARHFRDDAAAETVEQQLRDLDARTGVALRERVRAHDHRRSHDLARIRLADPAGVAPQEPELELLGQLLGNPRRDEAPEAGRDAVGRLVLAKSVFDDRARSGKLLPRRIVELRGSVLDRDVPDVVRGEVLPGQADRGRPSHGGASLARSPRGRTRA